MDRAGIYNAFLLGCLSLSFLLVRVIPRREEYWPTPNQSDLPKPSHVPVEACSPVLCRTTLVFREETLLTRTQSVVRLFDPRHILFALSQSAGVIGNPATSGTVSAKCKRKSLACPYSYAAIAPICDLASLPPIGANASHYSTPVRRALARVSEWPQVVGASRQSLRVRFRGHLPAKAGRIGSKFLVAMKKKPFISRESYLSFFCP